MPRKKLRRQFPKKMVEHNLPELPFDIISNIILRLPVKLIIQCKSLSKAYCNLISDPSFSHMYQNTKSNSMCTIFIDKHHYNPCFDLAEFDIRHIYNKRRYHRKIKKVRIYNTLSCNYLSIYGYCNGLLCFLKEENRRYELVVTNPILGEFVQLPDPGPYYRIEFAYGLGYCQVTNRYKVLRVIREYKEGGVRESRSQIFTLGYDQNWRSVSDVIAPYKMDNDSTPQSIMVPFRYALHWVVHSSPNFRRLTEEGELSLCVFDITEEKVRSLSLPPEVATARSFHGLLSVLSDKICCWSQLLGSSFHDLDLWVMDEYGVEGSWTKKFVIKMSMSQRYGDLHYRMPLVASPAGVIILGYKDTLKVYDLKKKTWLSFINENHRFSIAIPFVPGFVSLRKLVPELMLDVQC